MQRRAQDAIENSYQRNTYLVGPQYELLGPFPVTRDQEAEEILREHVDIW